MKFHFHDDLTINVTVRVLTNITRTNFRTKCDEGRTINTYVCPVIGGNVFQSTETLFKLIQDIIATNILTKFHDDRTINVASTVLTRKKCPAPWRPYIIKTNVLTYVTLRGINDIRKNAPTTSGHVFQPTGTILKLVENIIGTNVLTKFDEDRTINVDSRVKNAPRPPPPP
ncbi:hypothetical protein DPMN_157001 [Dreissena polymorpha]|uniref:Uncharacterized protein n=1 Tax=Dreissena polymorpha TaxID=45954 RepID=A0A9D4FWN3_DREPO|nr:hypothetical protein DPMN_157001 [Dreissena polymorpha]